MVLSSTSASGRRLSTASALGEGRVSPAQRADGEEQYQARKERETLPHNSAKYATGGRPEHTKITEVPEFLKQSGGTLVEFQLTGLECMARNWAENENVILGDKVSVDGRCIIPLWSRRTFEFTLAACSMLGLYTIDRCSIEIGLSRC
jgi:hypothetical protein